MGELVPVLALILLVLLVIGAVCLRKLMDRRHVVKPLEEMDMVERIKIPFNVKRAELLVKKLSTASEEAIATKKTTIVDHPDTDDRIIRFVITPE